MVWLPGSNNGEWGLNMSRGAMFPAVKGFNGPMGSLHYPLPNIIEHPTGVMDKPYLGRAFGRRFGRTVYELTPGGVTTEAGWGFSDKAKRFGHRRSRRSRSRSRRHRCEGITKQGKRCKHKTNDHFCKHHTKRRTSKK